MWGTGRHTASRSDFSGTCRGTHSGGYSGTWTGPEWSAARVAVAWVCHELLHHTRTRSHPPSASNPSISLHARALTHTYTYTHTHTPAHTHTHLHTHTHTYAHTHRLSVRTIRWVCPAPDEVSRHCAPGRGTTARGPPERCESSLRGVCVCVFLSVRPCVCLLICMFV